MNSLFQGRPDRFRSDRFLSVRDRARGYPSRHSAPQGDMRSLDLVTIRSQRFGSVKLTASNLRTLKSGVRTCSYDATAPSVSGFKPIRSDRLRIRLISRASISRRANLAYAGLPRLTWRGQAPCPTLWELEKSASSYVVILARGCRGRVEGRRGGIRSGAVVWPAAFATRRCRNPYHRSVSAPRSSNRTCRFAASGSPMEFTHRLTQLASAAHAD